jgi:hypothetical protein
MTAKIKRQITEIIIEEVKEEMLKPKKAQGTLEYIIVFTAIVAAIVLAANTFLKPRVNAMLDHVTNQSVEAVKHVNFE